MSSVNLWLNYSREALLRNQTDGPVPTAAQRRQLSHFTGCGEDELIEPLHGFGRHPLARLGCRSAGHHQFDRSVFHIDHLVLLNRCKQAHPACSSGRISQHDNGTRRNLFFDLGCAVYSGSVNVERGSKMGASLPLFYERYLRNCIEFDQLFGWEAIRHDPARWWADVPSWMRRKLTFFNEPTTAAGFFSFLRRTAHPADTVVVKVDIDHPLLENSIVEAIASTPDLAALVDELFFEYHFYAPELHKLPTHTNRWHRTPASRNDTVDAALDLMHRLRVAGVRSHFWI
eukprot:6254178-Prymnesium_polylepis.1